VQRVAVDAEDGPERGQRDQVAADAAAQVGHRPAPASRAARWRAAASPDACSSPSRVSIMSGARENLAAARSRSRCSVRPSATSAAG
jgi:hypothetical protein